ncbi:MAG: F0F1 ATP synthase subunit gamma [Alphaproteobacteria bacterium]|nr:F0F1 ATP synthase subunit gamma [Rickettsiales bacterium]
MPNIKSIKQRIKSTAAVTKITKVVQLVAAAKLRPSRHKLHMSAVFCRTLGKQIQMVGQKLKNINYDDKLLVLKKVSGNANILYGKVVLKSSILELTQKEQLEDAQKRLLRDNIKLNLDGNNLVIVAIGSQRGLCGFLNSSVAKSVKLMVKQRLSFLSSNGLVGRISVVYIGKKIYPLIKGLQTNMVDIICGSDQCSDAIDIEQIKLINAKISDIMLSCNAEDCIFVFQNFITVLKQEIVQLPLFGSVSQLFSLDGLNKKLIPFVETIFLDYNDDKTDGKNKVNKVSNMGDIMFIDCDMGELLTVTLEHFYNGFFSYTIRSSVASENALRMTSMDSATKNGEKLINKLELQANKLRQSTITGELVDLIGGASVAQN